MNRLLHSRYFTVTFLCCACAILSMLWLLSIQYPISKDAVTFALLGEGFWKTGVYSLLGEPHGKHIPLFPIVSYPFVHVLGYSIGMKVTSLLSGFAVLVASFFTVRKLFSVPVAVGVVSAVLFHHGFIYLASIGYSDLLFTALFLGFVYYYAQAEDSAQWYVAAGVCMGLAALTRYNGLPLFAVYVVYTIWKRREDIKSVYFWIGGLFGVGVLIPWFLHTHYYFGSTIPSSYPHELNTNYGEQFLSNIVYYTNPLHNILPILLLAAVVGLWKSFRSQQLAICSIVAVLLITSIWPVHGLRFAFPAYPLLLAFACIGITNLYPQHIKKQKVYIGSIIAVLTLTHLPVLCLYSSGACNAAFDRYVGVLPKNIGLTQEWVHSWNQARMYVNHHAEEGAEVLVGDAAQAQVWDEVFRDDITLSTVQTTCPAYRIDQKMREGEEVLFTTDDMPHVSVLSVSCV